MKFSATLANINKDAADLGRNNLSINTDIITASIKYISSTTRFDEKLSWNCILQLLNWNKQALISIIDYFSKISWTVKTWTEI